VLAARELAPGHRRRCRELCVPERTRVRANDSRVLTSRECDEPGSRDSRSANVEKVVCAASTCRCEARAFADDASAAPLRMRRGRGADPALIRLTRSHRRCTARPSCVLRGRQLLSRCRGSASPRSSPVSTTARELAQVAIAMTRRERARASPLCQSDHRGGSAGVIAYVA
jgi:hypothetical protein